MAESDHSRHSMVQIGQDRWVILCCRVALVPGLGQVWHTMDRRFAVSRIGVTGETLWSLLACSLTEFMVTLKVPSRLYEYNCPSLGPEQLELEL